MQISHRPSHGTAHHPAPASTARRVRYRASNVLRDLYRPVFRSIIAANPSRPAARPDSSPATQSRRRGAPTDHASHPVFPTKKRRAMATRRIHHRPALDRNGIAAYLSVSAATVRHWHAHRDTTGFPAPAHTDPGGRLWWWRTDIDTFHTTHRAARHATVTPVDHTGDPHELLTAPQAARVLGYANHRSITAQLRHRADHTTTLPSGRIRRYWYRATVWDYADSRPDHISPGRPPHV